MAHQTELNIHTTRKHECVDVTELISRTVSDSGIKTGVCVIFVPHTTAAVIANEHFDPNVAHDIINALDELVPTNKQWRHPEDNAPAHVKAALMTGSLSVPVTEGQLATGRWQGIYFLEFDGPRTRKLSVTVVG
ncbi:MAG: YjbQ family protein [Armatimonadetes bacterium]|nr:YjbQ family protein [Armatimonadota bacterium]